MLPSPDGLAISRCLLRELGPDRPAILLLSDQVDPEKARAAGVAGVLRRPFDGRTLRRRVAEVLRRPATEKDA